MDMHCLFGCTQWNELWNRDDEKVHSTCLGLMVVKEYGKEQGWVTKWYISKKICY